MADCCNHFSFTDDGDNFQSWQGLRGPYYTPHLSAEGVLSWTNTGNLPNPAPVDISGPPGSGVELRGPVASVADLPATAPSGELWLVGAASPYDGYFFNSGSWEDLGQIAVGPAGPQGERGPQGPVGPQGPQGPQGPAGQSPNLLDNWYFVGGGSQLGYGKLPVNQRGQATYSGTGYHIDRWANYNITRMDIEADGITIVASANGFTLIQTLANPTSYAGKTLTATALFSNVSGGTAGVRLAVGGAAYSGADLSAGGLTSVTRVLTSSDDLSSIAFNIRLSQGTTAKLIAVKLEINSTQTLAHQESGTWVLNEIPDYAEQLAKCQAYFLKTSLTSEYSCSLGTGGTNPRFFIPLPVTMAKTPSFTRISSDPFVFGVGSNTVIVGSSSSAIQISGGFSAVLFPNGVRISFQTTDAVGGAFLPCAIEVPTFELSAE